MRQSGNLRQEKSSLIRSRKHPQQTLSANGNGFFKVLSIVSEVSKRNLKFSFPLD